MSTSSLSEKAKTFLWVKAGGRCQYAGCNKPLWRDDLTMAKMNAAYIAHIIADEPGGPRGDADLSKELGKELSNLMLACDVHHRLVDREGARFHSVDVLLKMKEAHEQRIEIQTGISPDMKSQVVLYGSNVGTHHPFVNFGKAQEAMIPYRYPQTDRAIELGMHNCSLEDDEKNYWHLQELHLQRQFDQQLKPLLQNKEIDHLSVFSIAPQPLLMKLGHLLGDITQASVFQLHREPVQDWKWKESSETFEFEIVKPPSGGNLEKPTLVLALSAHIEAVRVTSVLGSDAAIWKITIPNPHNDFMKNREQLSAFRKAVRSALNGIKKEHGEKSILHVFPAMPISAAIEFGRVIMPKADLKMLIYDQNRKSGGFVPTLSLN